MRNLFIILVLILISWVIYANFFQPAKEENIVIDYAENLKTSVDKAEDAKKTANLVIIQSAIRSFKATKSRNPESIQELQKAGFLGSMNFSYYDYDSRTGEVSIK